ncbi:MAG: PKD domain-containing protein [Methanocorpusculum sp.]|nr:PKD domain-containing protein [Methanocorpusculum sp.]MDE2524855.1 PKD domain-containing protein [Methanocorpusculum sp.]
MNYRRWILLLLIFCIFLIGFAAADTNQIINGNFEDGVSHWVVDISGSHDYGFSSYSTPINGGQGGGAYLSLHAYAGTHQGAGVGKVTVAQTVNNGEISTIKYWYKYTGENSYGAQALAYMKVYWEGSVVQMHTLYTQSSSSWQQATIPITSTGRGGQIIFELYVPGTQSAQRDFTFDIDTVEVLSSGNAPTITSISVSPDTVQPAPATLTFTANGVSGSPAPQYLWIWGDGTSNTDYNLNTISHTFALEGSHTITLQLTNSDGVTQMTKTVDVGPPLPSGDFYPSISSGAKPLSVTFILTADDPGATYQWWFGDGNAITGAPDSTQAQPTHVYQTAGTYSVRLIITTTAGARTIDKPNLIEVTETDTAPVGQGNRYPPHSVQMRFMDKFGTALSGVQVSAVYSGSSGPLSWILQQFGISSQEGAVQEQSGITGVDGTISWLMYPQFEYTISVTYKDRVNTWKIYPQDTQYLFTLDVGGTRPVQNTSSAIFNVTGLESDTVMLSLLYSNLATKNVTFWVKLHNETIYSQQFISTTMNQSYTVPNVRGNVYAWGYTAYLTDGSMITDDRGITMRGGVGEPPLWDLQLQKVGLSLDWYMYIAYGIMILTASVFSQTTVKMGAVIVPACLGLLFVFVGWIPAEHINIISIAVVLGIGVYAAAKWGNA